jgi:hypothetical protein
MNLLTTITNKISEYIPLIHKSTLNKVGREKKNTSDPKRIQSNDVGPQICLEGIQKKRITYGKVQKSLPKKSQTTKKKLTTKQAIPKTVRNQVWRKFCGNHLDAKCFCCDQYLAYESWEAGHVMSEAKGGKTIVENLRPICLPCNRSMGTKHMYEFMKEYQLAGLKNIK